jgi:hypothetical protein
VRFVGGTRIADTLDWLARRLRHEDGPVYRYLDVSVAHLAPDEREVVLSTPDDPPIGVDIHRPLLPRVVPHRFGAFVNVPSELDDNELDAMQADGFASLVEVLVFAAQRGCNWINFDQDGAEIPELALYEDRVLPAAIAACPHRLAA